MSQVAPLAIRPIAPGDCDFVRDELSRNWLSSVIWSRDIEFQADELPGFIAWLDQHPVGLLTFAFSVHGKPRTLSRDELEIVTLSSRVENCGVGGALLSAAVEAARARHCRRVFLTTSNDNLRALGFYQRRGWRLVAIYRGMIDEYRLREKEIPVIAPNGIPIHDEIELELIL